MPTYDVPSILKPADPADPFRIVTLASGQGFLPRQQTEVVNVVLRQDEKAMDDYLRSHDINGVGAFYNDFAVMLPIEETILHLSIRFKKHRMTTKLLRHAANPNVHDSFGMTPLQRLSSMDSDKHTVMIAKALILHGADVNLSMPKLATPFIMAQRFRTDCGLLRLFYDAGAVVPECTPDAMKKIFAAPAAWRVQMWRTVWSPDTHAHFPSKSKGLVIELIKIAHRLCARFSYGLLDIWVHKVVPQVVGTFGEVWEEESFLACSPLT
tara:strand:+ start:1602 stop:2402 length:801 start_codon:yes stop_codon:yes gene_type:complete